MTIVAVSPTETCFPITWNLGIRCNYDCMYCSPEWHDNHSKHKSLSVLQQSWKNVYEKTETLGLKYKLSFTGGEVTVNKSFIPFLEWLRENYNNSLHSILITTNGSASYKYYEKMFTLVDNISFSTHSEHIDEKKFFDTVIKLRNSIDKSKFVHVNIMDEFWNTDRIVAYKRILEENAISYSVNKINYDKQTRVYPILNGRLNLEV